MQKEHMGHQLPSAKDTGERNFGRGMKYIILEKGFTTMRTVVLPSEGGSQVKKSNEMSLQGR